MIYSQTRLEEATRVIKLDIAQRRREQDDKYARTHYREDFHLRNQSKVSLGSLRLYHDNSSDLSDEDYDPGGRNSKRKKLKDAAPGSCLFDVRPQKTKSTSRCLRKRQYIPGNARSADVYITLRFHQSESRNLLREFAEKYQTYLNVWLDTIGRLDSDNESNMGCAGRKSLHTEDNENPGSRNNHARSLELVSFGEEDQYFQTRRLRNGKVLKVMANPKNVTPEEEDDSTEIPDALSNEHASEKVQTDLSLGTGSCVTDAIVIEDDGTDENDEDDEGEDDHIVNNSSEDDEDVEQVSSQNYSAAEDGICSIKTAFAHPMNFRSATRLCDFCNDYRFGILGYGLRSVVVARDTRNQIVEINNGHSETHPQTTMCVSCSLDRMLITRCTNHQPRRIRITSSIPATSTNSTTTTTTTKATVINAPSISQIDAKAYGNDLINQNPQRSRHPPQGIKHICSICPLPATHHCRTLQRRDKLLNPVRDPNRSIASQLAELNVEIGIEIGTDTNGKTTGKKHPYAERSLKPPLYGCGLRLCERCTSMIIRNNSNNSSSNRSGYYESAGGPLIWSDILKERGGDQSSNGSREIKGGPRMLRADVEFLFRHGELWRSFHHHDLLSRGGK